MKTKKAIDELKPMLRYLGLYNLEENIDEFLNTASKNKLSYYRFLESLVNDEYQLKKDKARLARIKRAKIPEYLVMETFPFSKQPRLKKREVMQLYDSRQYITEPQEMIFIGPTGCGKSGLATSFLIGAINQGFRGYFISFADLMHKLLQAKGDHSEKRILNRLKSYDILIIDELGHTPVEKSTTAMFFELIKFRNKVKTTLFTTQFGFSEWNSFLQSKHLTAALLDRLTVNCSIFNMKDCLSIRPRKINHLTKADK